MKQCNGEVLSNRPLTESVYEMILACDAGDCRPGQFVNVSLPGLYLRRPISVCDSGTDFLTLVYKAVGRGTERMTQLEAGTKLDLLTGLGNGYDLNRAGDSPLLIGGGVGIPPLYGLARALIREGKPVSVILGFNTGAEIFYEEAFRMLGAKVTVATADGSVGVKGFVTDALPCEAPSCFYACGPMPMLKALYRKLPGPGQFSLEERMGCGFGACMGCSMETKEGYRRICKEGPVFDREVLLWED